MSILVTLSALAHHATRAALRRARERVPQGIALTHAARHAERRAPSATRVKRLATVLLVRGALQP